MSVRRAGVWDDYPAQHTGQGVGGHQFSGLRTPIAHWYAVYFQLGSLNGGYDLWIRSRKFDASFSRRDAELALYSPRSSGAVAVLSLMAPGRYRATWNGRRVPVRNRVRRRCRSACLPGWGRAGCGSSWTGSARATMLFDMAEIAT
ncbi:MAG: hypothetical protein V4857_12940 [Pseudomonadota bacterium]